MKTILLLLLTCLPLCAATTYPMLSDTTNRTVTGGVTNLSFLNSNSVFTGTARWMGIVTLTNTGNIFVGDGAGLTGVGFATSGGVATNATIYGLTINTGSTNNALTGSRAMVTDANKGIVSSATTATELGFVSGVTSAIQTQINAKAASATLGGYVTNLGGLATNLTATGLTVATGQTNTHLTASSVVVTDANKGIVSGTTTADLATLSANQTFTGTNTFAPAKLFPANEIAIRRLWTSPTNIFLSSLVVSSAFTNNGDFANCTYIAQATLPALMGSNSHVLLTFTTLRSNANSTAGQMVVFAGTNTNYVGVNNAIFSASVGRTTAIQVGTLHNANSFTQQFGGASFQSQLILGPTSFTDTSVPFTIYLGAQTVTSFTNLNLYGLTFTELYAP